VKERKIRIEKTSQLKMDEGGKGVKKPSSNKHLPTGKRKKTPLPVQKKSSVIKAQPTQGRGKKEAARVSIQDALGDWGQSRRNDSAKSPSMRNEACPQNKKKPGNKAGRTEKRRREGRTANTQKFFSRKKHLPKGGLEAKKRTSGRGTWGGTQGTRRGKARKGRKGGRGGCTSTCNR